MNLKTLFFCVFSFSMLLSCVEEVKEDEDPNLKSENGFPYSPINLYFLNSEYDDYNSALPEGEYDSQAFVFSSNRNSKGKDFDFVLKSLGITHIIETGITTIASVSNSFPIPYTDLQIMLPEINSPYNEYGPFILQHPINGNSRDEEFLMLYTHQENSGRYIIRGMSLELINATETERTYDYNGPFDVSILNSTEYNLGYPVIENNKLYFNADIDGSYDIYEMDIDTSMTITQFLTGDENLQHKARKIIESKADDKCPYVVDDIMLFTSSRTGGHGGFDLYQSRFENEKWTSPENLGAEINSAYDEYRPVLRKYNRTPNDLLIFSSDREGGLGGFDLYYMGF